MDITELKAKYEVSGDLEKKLKDICPNEIKIYVPIEYIEAEEEGWCNYSSKEAVCLTVKIKYPNYPREEVKQAMKIACLRLLEEFC